MTTVSVPDTSNRGLSQQSCWDNLQTRHVTHLPFPPQKYNPLQNRPVRLRHEHCTRLHSLCLASYDSFLRPLCHGARSTSTDALAPSRKLAAEAVLRVSCRVL